MGQVFRSFPRLHPPRSATSAVVLGSALAADISLRVSRAVSEELDDLKDCTGS